MTEKGVPLNINKTGMTRENWGIAVSIIPLTQRCDEFNRYSESGTLIAHFDSKYDIPCGWVDYWTMKI